MGWAFLYMFLILKIPLLAALWLVWWSVRAQPDPADEELSGGGGGGSRHPRPHSPQPPRRGPHRDGPPSTPRRVRAVARPVDRAHR